jgi:adenosylcobinamide-GDP ribazoletransferase
MWQEIILAFSFLTVIPMPTLAYQPGLLGRAGRWFPLVGLTIGGLLFLAHQGLSLLFTPLLTAALVTTLWAALTGGLHLDGLADCCDGLLAATSRERRLEIMRDPRTGAFAVVGVVLFLLLKVTALAALPAAAPALLVAPTWARWLLLWVARQPLARPGGLGADFAAGLTGRALVWGLLLPLGLLLLLLTIQAFVAVVVAIGVTGWLMRAARLRLGGVTGDVYGLVVELSELAMLLVFAATVNTIG